ncbi:MAG: protease family protein [Actinomycetota bacterium]|nr:protease family protein [Actinomycetota bacterium]
MWQQTPVLYRGAPTNLVLAVEQGRPVKPARWGFPDFLITFGLWLFLNVLAAGVIIALGTSGAAGSIGIMVAITLPWLGLAGWPILVSFWRGNGPVLDYGLTAKWADIGWGVLYGLVALILAGAVSLLTQALFGEFNSAAGELADKLPQWWALLLFALLVGLGAPIVEELAYRGLLLGSLLKRNWAPWLAIGTSALLFSLTHFEPIRIPLLLSTGIVLGIARYHRGSTTTSIVAHMTNNIPAAVALFFI